jgi:hypothetical protein
VYLSTLSLVSESTTIEGESHDHESCTSTNTPSRPAHSTKSHRPPGNAPTTNLRHTTENVPPTKPTVGLRPPVLVVRRLSRAVWPLFAGDGVAQEADAFDFAFDDVAGSQKYRGFASSTDTGRRAGRNDVARLQCHETG